MKILIVDDTAVFNIASGVAHPDKWFAVRNEATEPAADVMIYNKIGKDLLGEDGIAAKDFADALKAIPMNREINVRINSVGGNVWDGMAIYQMLKARRDKVVCRVDGVAASIAAVISCAGRKTVMPKNAMMMIHPAQGICMGDAKKMRDNADKLEAHNRAIAGVLAEKCGKSPEAVLAMMEAGEKWMTGEEAKQEGFCDECDDEIAISNCVSDLDFSQFRRVPEVLGTPQNKTNQDAANAATKGKTVMEKAKIIAMLKTHGIEVANDASDEVVLNALAQLGEKVKANQAGNNIPANVVALQQQVQNISTQLEAARREVVTRDVQACVDEGRIPAAMKDKAISRVMADASYLEELRGLPQNLIGSAPVHASAIEVVSDDVKTVLNQLGKAVGSTENFKRGIATVSNSGERSAVAATLYAAHREKLLQVFNAGTNTISADLKRVAILQETIRAFALRVLPLRAFATVFSNVPLEGTNEAVVPYFPLRTDASTDWNAANGYVFSGTTNSSAKKVTLNKRKYQPLDYTSETFRRQPYFDAVTLGKMNAEKLGVDVLNDVWSAITLATYGAAAFTGAANTFDSDDVIDIGVKCNEANWPDTGRSLILNAAYDGALKKDTSVKNALNFGGSEVIRQGQVPTILGFDYYTHMNMPANGENLVGVAAFKSALLAAFAPVDPAAGVRSQLIAYDVATDPATGISLNYRHWGDAQMDIDHEVLECAYGYVAGETAAIKRLTSA